MKSMPSISALALAGAITMGGSLGTSGSPAFAHVANVPSNSAAAIAGQPHNMITPVLAAAVVATEWLSAARFVVTTFAITRTVTSCRPLASPGTPVVADISTLDK